jgi:pyruvate,water dikinase
MTSKRYQNWIIPLAPSEISHQELTSLAGGKGANLVRLSSSGLPVPPGFILSTAAYQQFVEAYSLESKILNLLPGENEQGFTVLESSSRRIRKLFSPQKFPGSLTVQLIDAYSSLGRPPVAVRSSATVEDLPGLSFAGQQDTYLNIINENSLLKAVADCFSSLWTARAIGYRNRNGISHKGISLAVVIQQMVQSEVSGVLFTANPLTGLRGEVVIDATFGLGEALVSGRVEPDHYVVDTLGNAIFSKTLGSKELAIRSAGKGGTALQKQKHASEQALTDGQILELAILGKKVESLDGIPQDIEWALAGGRLHLLQSRPITSIYPLPVNPQPAPLDVYASFGAVQGMLEPMTPMGRNTMDIIIAVMSAKVLREKITPETQTVLLSAGERIWIRYTPIIKNTVGRKLAGIALKFVEPTILQAMNNLMDDPRLQPEHKGIRSKTFFLLAFAFLPLAWNIIQNILSPEKRRMMIVQNGEDLLGVLNDRIKNLPSETHQRMVQAAGLIQDFCNNHLAITFLLFVSGVASGMASYNFLHRAASEVPDTFGDNGKFSKASLLLEVTRGMPNNPTTLMDLDLWKVAQAIRADPEAKVAFELLSPDDLSKKYQRSEFNPEITRSLQYFLAKYGLRGFGEIDLGRQRWIENPASVFESLKGYVRIEDPSRAPDAVFRSGVESANQAIEKLAAEARKHKHGWIRSRQVRFFSRRARLLMGVRENPKFFAVRLMGLIREALLENAAELVSTGELERPDDIFFLSFKELARFASGEKDDWATMIQSRRDVFEYEKKRRQVPRMILSDGRTIYEGMVSQTSDSAQLTGSPVSPGRVEGLVRVVLDPRTANLQPGEILVCPGTDPSWTPLFLTAGGLIMEVGGMMTHGAVVAREYGIPAAVGVHEATTRLVTGQRICLDGSSGLIQTLDHN